MHESSGGGRSSKGPIFADDSNFDVAFKLFHGEEGVVPLSRPAISAPGPLGCKSPVAASSTTCPAPGSVASCSFECTEGSFSHTERGLANAEAGSSFSAALAAAPMATIGLSAFGGGGGPFGFDAFREGMEARRERKRREAEEKQRQEQQQERQQRESEQSREVKNEPHEALGDDWLATGNCPIARSYRAFNRVVPAIAAAWKPPPGVKYVCPPAIVAMRAAVAKHPFMQKLRPQALPIRVLAIGTMGLFLNIPLGAWREHYEKFSPQWILIVHASVPFVAILRKAALMPKYAMAFTIAASIVGQTVGSRSERKCLRSAASDSGYEGIPATKRKPRTRELGSGLRGLGVNRSGSVAAYDISFLNPWGSSTSSYLGQPSASFTSDSTTYESGARHCGHTMVISPVAASISPCSGAVGVTG